MPTPITNRTSHRLRSTVSTVQEVHRQHPLGLRPQELPPETADRWAFLRLDHDHPAPDGRAGRHWLMVRRHRRTGELAFYRCHTPRPTPLAVLVRVAGRRWRVEERFQTGKGLCGLDQHQVRRWRSWYRWATLAVVAHAFLVVAAVLRHTRHPPPPGLIGITCNEVSHLYATRTARPLGDHAHRLRWSLWRRRHQARARTCRCCRQANGP